MLAERVSTQKYTRHGKSNTSLYNAWCAMLSRCSSPGNTSYKDYGGRGISVCAEWRDSFETFEFYVAQLPHFGENDYTLDRIDNDGNYEPGNVRWATSIDQHRNFRRNRMVTYNGKTQCVAAWAEETGIAQHTICWRLEHGWPIGKALTKRSQRRHAISPASTAV